MRDLVSNNLAVPSFEAEMNVNLSLSKDILLMILAWLWWFSCKRRRVLVSYTRIAPSVPEVMMVLFNGPHMA